MCPRGRYISANFSASNKIKNCFFSKPDWDKWLKIVSDFYRDSKNEISPLFIKKPRDNRPYISVKLFDQDITVLFDSGATASVVGTKGLDILRRFNLKIYPANLKNICTADGTQKNVEGIVDLPIVIGDICQIITVLVVPTLPHSFIFGCDFAKQFKISVNFKNNSWQVQANLANMEVPVARNYSDFNFEPLCSIDDLSFSERKIAENSIASFNEINSKNRLGRTDKLTLTIDTGDAPPFHKKQYPMSPYMSQILNRELDEMLQLGVVEPSQSPWSSPVLLVKKSNGEFRFVFDGRFLNNITKFDSYALPSIDKILSSLRNAKFISSIDLRKAFWQIPLDECSKDKTTFNVPGRGSFRFNTVPFGLCNAAQAQQRLVDAIFGAKYEPFIFTYLDDILICSPDFEHHVKLLEDVRKKLKEANLTINLEKCDFFKTSLKFLGYIVGSNSLRTDPDKISAMVNYARPRNATEVKRFVGLCSWYRRFINNFSTLMSPINDLLKGRRKSQPITWTDAAEASFVKIKELLVSSPILSQPDFSKPFIITSDASLTGVGGALSQIMDGDEHIIAYASRSLTRAERNYSVVERECLGVLFCLDKFRMYIEGAPKFKIITDCYSLLWLNNMKNPTGKLARWSVRLRQHNFELIHRRGVDNVVADALSRIPPHDQEDPPVVSLINPFSVDVDRIDPWYNDLREKIIMSPDKYTQWKVEDEFVLKFIPNKLPMNVNIPEWKILVPNPQISDVIQHCHCPPTSGHFGFYKTLNRVQDFYYWPKMRRDVLKFVKSCLVCGAQKVSNTSRMGLMGKEKKVDLPFQCLAADLMGPFPRSKKGHKWLLVVADWFTKYTLLYPLRSSKSSFIERILENQIFLVFGCPETLICDNGSQFICNSFKNLCKKYEIRIRYNALYSAQCNFVERNNRTVGTAIRSYIDDHDSWDTDISKIQQAINTSKHEVTHFTPAFLAFGRHPPLSGKFYSQSINENQDTEIIPGDRNSYAENIQGLREIFVDVKKRLHAAYERNSRAYNLRKRDIAFNQGDRVWRKNQVLSNAANHFMAKLAPKYILSIVHKKISNLIYELKNLDGSKAGRWHIKDLKKYNGTDLENSDQDSQFSE